MKNFRHSREGGNLDDRPFFSRPPLEFTLDLIGGGGDGD
jgi:hypothetical protein